MKTLHKFTVPFIEKRNKPETIVKDGQPYTGNVEVDETVNYTFILKPLSRSETDSARLFNGACLKRAIDAGMITKAVLVQKHIDGNGSLISKETARRIVELNQEIQAIKDLVQELGPTNKDKEKEEKQTDYLMKLDDLVRELRAIEGSNKVVFNSTAENYASERSNLWIMLNQTYVERNGKPEPFFGPGKFEEKELQLEKFEEDGDKLYFAAAEKLSVYWGYYLGGLVNTPEDFVELDKRLAEAAEKAKKEEEESKKADEDEGLKPADDTPPTPTS